MNIRKGVSVSLVSFGTLSSTAACFVSAEGSEGKWEISWSGLKRIITVAMGCYAFKETIKASLGCKDAWMSVRMACDTGGPVAAIKAEMAWPEAQERVCGVIIGTTLLNALL